jgi:hypothetical protein
MSSYSSWKLKFNHKFGTLLILWHVNISKCIPMQKSEWPYLATTHVFKLLINSLSSSLILHNFSLFFLGTKNGYGFLSKGYMFLCPSTKKLMKLFFHPLTWGLWDYFQASKQFMLCVTTILATLVIENNFDIPIFQLFRVTSILLPITWFLNTSQTNPNFETSNTKCTLNLS